MDDCLMEVNTASESEVIYQLYHTNTWQRHKETSFTDAYFSSISHLENIKTEECEDKANGKSTSSSTKHEMEGEVDGTVFKKENINWSIILTGGSKINGEHINKKQFVCDQCKRGFSQKGCLKQHKLIHKAILHVINVTKCLHRKVI